MEEGNTYLEDFLLSLEHLPNDIRRDFELIKELDKECIELNMELTKAEDDVLRKSKRKYKCIDDDKNIVDTDHNDASNTDGSSASTGDGSGNFDEEINFKMVIIKELRCKIRQNLSEKTAIASNIGEIIAKFSRKLDTDLAFFETELKGCGEFDTPKGAGAEPGSEVAFTLEHQPSISALSTATTLVGSSSLSSSSTTALSSMGVGTGNSIAATTTIMNSIIDYSATISNEDVSIISPSKASKLMLLDKEVEKVMMLGRVIFYHVDSSSYEILDVDDSKNYLLPESQVTVLDLMDTQRRLSKYEFVYALYPDTTSFYPAVVVQSTRKLLDKDPCVILQFLGDEDESGLIPTRTVPLKYVVRQSTVPSILSFDSQTSGISASSAIISTD